MKYLPRWLIAKFKKDGFKCPTCNTDFDQKGVYAAGIKDSYADKNKSVPFVEYCCPTCEEKKLIELPIESSLIEFSVSIIDDIDNEVEEMNRQERPVKYHKKGVKKAKRRNDIEPQDEPADKGYSKSRITKEEIKKAVDMMDSSKSWDEFLKKIGAPMEFAYLNPLEEGDTKGEKKNE